MQALLPQLLLLEKQEYFLARKGCELLAVRTHEDRAREAKLHDEFYADGLKHSRLDLCLIVMI